MGHRTTIILNNDHLDQLVTNPSVGRRIYEATIGHGFSHDGNFGCLGHVVESAHADVARLGIIGKGGGFSFTELASSHNWRDEETELNLLKEAADKLGYKLVKKPSKK